MQYIHGGKRRIMVIIKHSRASGMVRSPRCDQLARQLHKVLESEVSTRNENMLAENSWKSHVIRQRPKEKRKRVGRTRWDWKEERMVTTRSRLVFTGTHVIQWYDASAKVARPQAVEASCY